MSHPPLLKLLEKKIGYQFKDPHWLNLALLHPSRASSEENNQRLEFLGDAVLELVITDALYLKYPDNREGFLTQYRSSLVNSSRLCKLAKKIELGEFLQIGKGEEKKSGRKNESNLAAALEALFGAIYKDGGWKKAQEIILQIFASELSTPPENFNQKINPKGVLQEILQQQGDAPPIYRCLSEEGKPHDRTYHVTLLWNNKELCDGIGKSKKAAENDAARHALEKIRSTS